MDLTPDGVAHVKGAKILGVTDYGKRVLGLNAPRFVKQWRWRNHAATLARKDERWCLAVVRANVRTGTPDVKVIEFFEDQVNKDARELGMMPELVAIYEAEGTLKARYGWDG